MKFQHFPFIIHIWLPISCLSHRGCQLLTLLLIWPLTFLTQTAGTAMTPLPLSPREPPSPSYWPQVRLHWSRFTGVFSSAVDSLGHLLGASLVCLFFYGWSRRWMDQWVIRSSVIETISSSCFLQSVASDMSWKIWFSVPILSSNAWTCRASVSLIATSNTQMDTHVLQVSGLSFTGWSLK